MKSISEATVCDACVTLKLPYKRICGWFSTHIDFIAQKVTKSRNEISGKQVVILIDEYDKPLLANIDNPELQNKFRNMLQGFYSVLKAWMRQHRGGSTPPD